MTDLRTQHNDNAALVLFRKGDAPAGMTLQEVAEMVQRKLTYGEIRKDRTAIVALFLAVIGKGKGKGKTSFACLPLGTQRDLDVPAGALKAYEAGKGIVLPSDGKVSKSQADSLKNGLCKGFGFDPEAFAIAYVKGI